MGPDRDQTCDPWICSQTCICSQTRYRLRYAARPFVDDLEETDRKQLTLPEAQISLPTSNEHLGRDPLMWMVHLCLHCNKKMMLMMMMLMMMMMMMMLMMMMMMLMMMMMMMLMMMMMMMIMMLQNKFSWKKKPINSGSSLFAI